MHRRYKTDKDLAREITADEINGKLVGTGINVIGGGNNGPYTLIVKRLNRKELNLLVRLIKAAKNIS
jgi:hypothetical protein